MKDPKNIIAILGTLALGACALVCVVRGDFTHASTFAALLVPSLGQATAGTALAPILASIEGTASGGGTFSPPKDGAKS